MQEHPVQGETSMQQGCRSRMGCLRVNMQSVGQKNVGGMKSLLGHNNER